MEAVYCLFPCLCVKQRPKSSTQAWRGQHLALSCSGLCVCRGCGVLAPVANCTGVWYRRATAVSLASMKSLVTLCSGYLPGWPLLRHRVCILMQIHAAEGAENAPFWKELSGTANSQLFPRFWSESLLTLVTHFNCDLLHPGEKLAAYVSSTAYVT